MTDLALPKKVQMDQHGEASAKEVRNKWGLRQQGNRIESSAHVISWSGRLE
ncbi:hypothetical protein CBOM_05754 [Ceraceosorus bombacis]|uniref:Uncharacterized protein n=1 Tax=Ceraceosorus bombacis TaxID=401625 RepID=A0A0P1BRH2_9BASI|nr:hypothetical protein CBOM_05754 [Ceraceosorus bombacis]